MHLHAPSTAPVPTRTAAAPGERWDVPRVSTGWATALAVVALLLALAVSPPWLPPAVGAAVHAAFALVCHQLDGRSFHAHGLHERPVAFAVCHRCTGIYAGLVAGVLAWPLARNAVERWMSPRVVVILGLACVPIGIDWALGATGLWANTAASQALTGGVFGAVAGLLAARGAAQVGAVRAVAPSAPSARVDGGRRMP